MKRKLFLFLCALLTSVGMWAAVDWTDKTSLITNPSFETDEAIADLKNCGWATDRVTGWTISPSSSSNAQVGVGNSSSIIQGIGDTFSPYAGDKYFYTRNNWNASTNYSFSQVITRDGDNMPAGLYKLTCKAATYSSDAAFNTLTLGLKEGTGSAVTHNGIVLNHWNIWGVIIYKRADDTNLTIEVNFIPGHDGGGKHYALLMDDFHLEFISEADAFSASSSNTIDFSDIINNAGIYNHSTNTTMPRGWTAYKHTTGNGHYTEGGPGDTRLEGWSGGNLDIDYYQQITNLPVGSYTVTAAAHESAEVGRTYVYAYTEGEDKAHGLVNSNTVQDITTSALKVSNGTMNIGIESTANDWVTADNFRISFLGFDVDAVKTEYETAYSNATTARDAAENVNVVGTERTALVSAITTYTTDKTESYSWYVNAKEALDDATEAFTGARATYDALVAEIAKAKALGIDAEIADAYAATSSSTSASVLASTQDLMVDEYEFVRDNYQTPISLGSWAETGTNTMPTDFNNEHWSGTAVNYKNQNDNNGQGWNANTWSMGLNQDITLPAGDYVLKVAGRKSQDAYITLTVTKKSDSSKLGEISDFPSSNDAKGINTSGETDFATGDGHNYANGGKGYGWQWRYVPFSLTEETTVNIAVAAGSSLIHNWASFGDYAVWSKPNVPASLIAYNKAKDDAATAKSEYPSVTGSELTDLNDALDADPGSTVESIDAATADIIAKTGTLIAAAPSYDAYLLVKGYGEAIDAELLPYATSTKLSAVTTALATSVTSASTAEAATAVINTANRAAYESNAIAENVPGVSRTNLIKNAYGSATDGWSGEFWTMNGEPYTQADGTTATRYFDKNGVKTFTTSQTIKLPKGNYILSVTARAESGIDSYKMQVTNNADETEEVSLTAMGNQNGVFNRGWNDAFVVFEQKDFGDATITITGDNTTSDANFWMSWGRFRLYSISGEGAYEISEDEAYTPVNGDVAGIKVSLARTIKSDVVNTLVLPFDMSQSEVETAFGTGSKVYVVDSYDAENEKVVFSQDENGITANKPCLLKATSAGTAYNFTGRTLKAGTATDTGENISMTGNYAKPFTVPENNYIISGGSIYLVNSEVAMKTMRAYITLTNSSSARVSIAFDDDDPTAINAIEAAEESEDLKDGKYLIDSKIVIVKNGVKYSANGQILK